jgi:hypothetical protein
MLNRPAVLIVQEVPDVLKRQPRGIFASPVGQTGADRLRILEAGDVVTAVAAVFGDGLAADVRQPLLVGELFPFGDHEVLLGGLHFIAQPLRQPLLVILLQTMLGERLAEVLNHQGLERATIDRLACLLDRFPRLMVVASCCVFDVGLCDVRRISEVFDEIFHGIAGRGVALGVLRFDGIEIQVRHQRANVVLRGILDPAIEPLATLGIALGVELLRQA